MRTSDVRKRFLQFFKNEGHAIYPSSSTIPHDDPTLLFTNAGMNQFKPIFLGASKLDTTRVATSQKCIRVGGKHNDLDNVGFTTRHLTFFEMLGNFSFGDYFKEEAIRFAFHLATTAFNIDVKRLWASVYEEDDEAFALWEAFLPSERIVRLGAKDNFWSMGETGPCGPCTELLFDRGEAYGAARTPKEDTDGERFFEFWNLVFMQFNRDASGTMHKLPRPCVDTGMGLERIASLLINSKTVFETDVLRGIITETERLSGKTYESDKPPFHVIADHLRMLSFTIADGAVPSNLDRGYVMRKVLRRAVRYGKRLGFDAPFLAKLFPTLLASMSDYSELATSQSKICEVLTLEEEQFFRTLKRGGNILTNILETSKHISGEDAFKLKDTYGFPIEEILLIAKDNHLDVHLEAYELLEAEAKERSRTAQTKHAQVAEENTFKDFKTHFVGYDTLTTHGSIIGIIVDGALTDRIEAGEHGMLILDTTSFYGEGGGQVGDTGTISHASAHFSVSKATKPFPGVIAHQGVLSSGILLKGEPVQATVERTHRQRTSQNHTATHLLHWALEQVLGPHIRQAGSLVEPDRIRFDFSHHKPLTHDEIRSVEERVNEKIRQNAAVSTYTTAYDSVKQDAHIKQFFGDKYGAEVRVVAIAPFSKELCGGTHVHSLQEIGLFRITGESSIAAGSRRIEAVTGSDAETFMYTREDLLNRLCQTLSTNTTKVHETLSSLLEEQKKQKEELRHLRRLQTNLVKETLLKAPEHIGSTTLILKEVQLPKEECNTLANDLAGRLESFVLLIAHKDQDRCQLLLRISPDLVAKGIKANELLAEIAKPVGGGGGGKADSAQAGGKDPSRLSESLTLAKTLISSKL